MPKHKQPLSLMWTSMVEVTRLIQGACDNIYNSHMSSNDHNLLSPLEASSEAIEEVRRYFIDPLPYLLREMICNRRHLEFNCENYVNKAPQKLLIFLRVVMHKDLTIFHIPVLKLLPSHLGALPDSFWCQQLSTMNKLQSLNLANVCTDELLRVISESCPLLEDIKVVSKSRNMSAEFNFNALRKAYHVTDSGLLYLRRCKRLKRISIGVARMQNRQITPKGILTLMLDLPDLQGLNYPYMDAVLQNLIANGIETTFKIEQIVDKSCTLSHAQMLAAQFQNLKRLHLDLSQDMAKEKQLLESTAILKLLADSSLKLNSLRLGKICVSKQTLLEFLSVKGAFLSELILYDNACEIDAKTLILIGTMCPYLVQMCLQNLETGDFCGQVPPGLFPHLKDLSIISRNSWDLSILLSILIKGEELVTLNIDVHYRLCNINNFFTNFFKYAKLPKLRKIIFGGSAIINQSTLENLYNNCPNLETIMCEESLVQLTKQSFLDDLRDEINSKNYDFCLYIFG
ncbi:Hypothetical predicted protein [Cloeon dipterum]|uniref:Uncharacterized protein n=1 Tax=Cloeon dipterum TaxID=197152 RepID=A0A8S1DQJ1_9INSE|nr:Hypothetical predicted protein [Cloeon dipterum]